MDYFDSVVCLLLTLEVRILHIPPTTTQCKWGCCTRTNIPLTLAYAKTIHTFQGQTVGPAAPGRPENPIKRILVDPGDQTFEGNNIGLFYTAVS
jgi:hypothetical protein